MEGGYEFLVEIFYLDKWKLVSSDVKFFVSCKGLYYILMLSI